MLTIVKEDAVLGATITDLNLAEPLAEQDSSELQQALAEHQVLFFRDQHVSHRSHRNLGLTFGSLGSVFLANRIDGVFITDTDIRNVIRVIQGKGL